MFAPWRSVEPLWQGDGEHHVQAGWGMLPQPCQGSPHPSPCAHSPLGKLLCPGPGALCWPGLLGGRQHLLGAGSAIWGCLGAGLGDLCLFGGCVCNLCVFGAVFRGSVFGGLCLGSWVCLGALFVWGLCLGSVTVWGLCLFRVLLRGSVFRGPVF